MSNFFKISTKVATMLMLLFFTACSENKKDIDLSGIEVKLDIRHFEKDLFENNLKDYNSFISRYPFFLTDFNKGIIGFQGNEQEAFDQLMLYKTDVNALKMYDHVKKSFGNFKPWEDELTMAYKRFRYYFPNEKIPTIVTFTGNFSFFLNPVGQDYIGIALDMHMGSGFKPYEYAQIENYWRKILIPESIATNHMLAHANDLFASTNNGNKFIDDMMYFGKLLYFLDCVLPDVPDHIKIGLTESEFNWCNQEENQIWTFIIKEKYLYETDKKRYDRLLKEGPFTVASNVPEKTPPMIGRFSGWMAVRKYMKENPKIELAELMKESDANKILQKGAYKP